MFQQGHLTRRQDPLWGLDEVVIRANADTFHVTNRSPQVGYFNMGIRKSDEEAKKHFGGTLYWRALEEYVLQNARADRKRVTVFTGPIFDDANDIAWSRGRDDMKGFKAPREYWKLMLRVDNGLLHATALIADQSPLIDFVPELLDVTDEEARQVSFNKVKKYHVSVAELQRRTRFDFGPDVAAADTFTPGGGDEANRRPVENIEDVSFDRPSGSPRTRTKRAASRRGVPARRSNKRRPA
jgi:endonuclease G